MENKLFEKREKRLKREREVPPFLLLHTFISLHYCESSGREVLSRQCCGDMEKKTEGVYIILTI